MVKWFECEECGGEVVMSKQPNFCPHCGAEGTMFEIEASRE